MRVEIRIRNTDLANALQNYVERRLSTELGRFADHVGRVLVKISGLSGPQGGTKRRCRMSVQLKTSRRVVVQETDLDLYTAIDRAAARVGRLVGQRIEREQALRFETQIAPAA